MTESGFSYRALLRDSIRHHGIAGTAAFLARGFGSFVRDTLVPSRRRLRFGDLDFDFEQGMDTTWSNIKLRTRFREIFSGRGYQATDPVIFTEMMECTKAGLREFTFVDLGCGKGRALLLARRYPFRRIVGVELLPELLQAAHGNIGRLPAEERPRFELHGMDAREYDFPPEATFLYLFDPFPPAILREIMRKLARSLEQYPRTVLIGYQNPVSEYVLASMPEFSKLDGTQQWALYGAKA